VNLKEKFDRVNIPQLVLFLLYAIIYCILQFVMHYIIYIITSCLYLFA